MCIRSTIHRVIKNYTKQITTKLENKIQSTIQINKMKIHLLIKSTTIDDILKGIFNKRPTSCSCANTQKLYSQTHTLIHTHACMQQNPFEIKQEPFYYTLSSSATDPGRFNIYFKFVIVFEQRYT